MIKFFFNTAIVPHPFFPYSSIPVGFRATLMSFLSFLSQKHIQEYFEDQRLFEAEIIKENVVFGHHPYHHRFVIPQKCHKP